MLPSSYLWMVYLAVVMAIGGSNSVCDRGKSTVTVEMWPTDDQPKSQTTPHSLVFENVALRGNMVLMCDIGRQQAREILCTYNRGCQRTPELAFPGLRIASEKQGWVEGDEEHIAGEEKGCLAHYALKQQENECNLDLRSVFGIRASPCISNSTVTSTSKTAVYSGQVRQLNGTTLRHVMRSSNIGHYFNEDFFHFFRLLTPFASSSVSRVGPVPNNVSNSISNSTAPRTAPVFSPKEQALSAFRPRKSGKSDSSSSFSSSSRFSHVLLDSVIDYRNWSASGVRRYERSFSEGRGAADGMPNARDVDGAGLGKAPLEGQAGYMYYKQNKEWVRSLVYCSVIRPFQLAQTVTNATETNVSARFDPRQLQQQQQYQQYQQYQQQQPHQFFQMQETHVALQLERLVVQPFERCPSHGKVEPTTNFDERKRRFASLRADVHSCVALNESTAGSTILLYGRSDTNKRRWSNVYDLAARLQAAPGVGLPVRVIERMPHTFREQINLFASAKLLVTVLGSALMNVPFMPYSSTIVEMVRFGKGETSLIKTFGLDAAVAVHVVVDINSAPSPSPIAAAAASSSELSLNLPFNLLRQKLCDRHALRKLVGGGGGGKRSSSKDKKEEDPMGFADMGVFCRNVTSGDKAVSLKGLSGAIISSFGGV